MYYFIIIAKDELGLQVMSSCEHSSIYISLYTLHSIIMCMVDYITQFMNIIMVERTVYTTNRKQCTIMTIKLTVCKQQ